MGDLLNLTVSMSDMPFLWDITNLFKNLNSTIKTVGGLIIVGLGLVLLVIGAFKIGGAIAGSANGGGRAGKIGLGVACLLVGGAFAAKGIDIVMTIGEGGADTIELLGK